MAGQERWEDLPEAFRRLQRLHWNAEVTPEDAFGLVQIAIGAIQLKTRTIVRLVTTRRQPSGELQQAPAPEVNATPAPATPPSLSPLRIARDPDKPEHNKDGPEDAKQDAHPKPRWVIGFSPSEGPIERAPLKEGQHD